MPRDVLPEKLVTPTRDELVRRYERDWKLRVPGAQIGPNTEPGIKARILADALLPLYGEAARNAQFAAIEDMDRDQLKAEAARLGLVEELPAVGASGAVVITASSGGGTIFAGDELVNELTGLRYQCAVTAVYADGASVPVAGVDTGPVTNVAADTRLKWRSPRPGIAAECVVAEQTDGSGLSGGRDEETDDEIRDRISDARANPPASGNDAEYRLEAAKVTTVAPQAVFTWPCIDGPGTIGLGFTIRPQRPGGSRLSNSTQRAAVRAHLVGRFPADDGLLDIELIANDVDMRLKVDWAPGASGWVDASPWPAYHATEPMFVSAVTSATAFSIDTVQASPTAPQVGQNIAFYDAATGVFRRKKLLTVGAGPPWAVTIDTSNGVSDVTYTPSVNELMCPWSDSLDALIAPIAAEFDKLGPGEMVTFFDEGLRQKRTPVSPSSWPSVITGRMATPLYDLPVLADVQIIEPTLPYETPLGTPGVSANLHQLATLLAFPL